MRVQPETSSFSHLQHSSKTDQTNAFAQRIIKSLIELDHLGVQVGYQRLVFAGKQLDNGRTLDSYNITEKSTLQLIVTTKSSFGHQLHPVIF